MTHSESPQSRAANSFLPAGPKFLKAGAFILAALYVFFLNPHLDIRGFNATDSAAYLARVQSLLGGHGYGEKFAEVFYPVTMQSPVFSWFLMPPVALFGMNFLALKIYMLLFALAFALVLILFFNYFLGNKSLALPAALLVLASPPVFGLAHRVLSDIPFTLFSCLGLFFLDRYLKTSKVISLPLAVSSFCIAVAYGLKPSALAILFGGGLLFLHPAHRSFKTLIKLILCAALFYIPVYFWKQWCASVPAVGYWAQPLNIDWQLVNPYDMSSARATWMDHLVRARQNIVWGLSANIAVLFAAPLYLIQSHGAAFLASIPVVLWLFWMGIRSFLKNPSVLEGFIFTILVTLTLKFEGSAIRYTVLLYPAFTVYAFRGFFVTPSGFKIKSALYKGMLGAAILTTAFTAADQWKNPYGTPLFSDYIAISKTAREKLPASDLCAAPAVTHWQLLTGHSCFDSSEESVLFDVSKETPDYFVTLSKTFPRDISRFIDFENRVVKEALKLTELVEKNPALFEEAAANGTFAVYKKVKT